jgi:hypothetical protein
LVVSTTASGGALKGEDGIAEGKALMLTEFTPWPATDLA